MSLSILHFADLHLDTSFADSRLPPEIGRRCREQLRATLMTIVRIAHERRADAVTIAGDLFENERVQIETLQFIAEQFAQLAPTPVYIAPGLGDHAGLRAVYQTRRWPANVHIFLNNTLSDRPLSAEYELWGAARQHGSDHENVLEGFVAPSAGKIPILLLHTRVVPPEENNSIESLPNRSGMLTLDGIAHSGFAAALIGQQHQRFINRNQKCTALCPGSPQPLGFDEAAEHGAVWVQLSPGSEVTGEWLPLQDESSKALDFKTVDIPIEPERSIETLIDTITQALRYQNLRDCLVRVRLVGSASLAMNLEANSLAARLEHHCAYLRIENHTVPMASQLEAIAQIGKEPTLRGAFVREMLAQRKTASTAQQLNHAALLYGVQSFEQESIVLR